jgi:hypothetical protein
MPTGIKYINALDIISYNTHIASLVEAICPICGLCRSCECQFDTHRLKFQYVVRGSLCFSTLEAMKASFNLQECLSECFAPEGKNSLDIATYEKPIQQLPASRPIADIVSA